MKWNNIELKVGDKVRLKNERGFYWDMFGDMDRYCGRVVTISEIVSQTNRFHIEQDADDISCNWSFTVDDIAEVLLKLTTTEEPIHKLSSTVVSQEYSINIPKYTSRIKIGSWEINLTDKTFTDYQIKNMEEMLGWDVENLVEV